MLRWRFYHYNIVLSFKFAFLNALYKLLVLKLLSLCATQILLKKKHIFSSQKIHHHLTWSIVDAFFHWSKPIGFCPSLPADALMNLVRQMPMRRGGGGVCCVWGPPLELSKWWKSQGFQGPLKMSERVKSFQKMGHVSTKNDGFVGRKRFSCCVDVHV